MKFTHWLWRCAVKAGYCKLKFTQPTYYIWYYGTTDIRRHTPFIRTVTSSQPKTTYHHHYTLKIHERTRIFQYLEKKIPIYMNKFAKNIFGHPPNSQNSSIGTVAVGQLICLWNILTNFFTFAQFQLYSELLIDYSHSCCSIQAYIEKLDLTQT